MPGRDFVQGKKTSDLLDLDPSTLTEDQLRQVNQRIRDAANKRIRAGASDDYAYLNRIKNQDLFQAGPKKGTKGAVNKLRKQFIEMKHFMQSVTSSKRGRTKVRKEFEKKAGRKLSKAELKEFWAAYGKLKEESKRNPALQRVFNDWVNGSDRIISMLHNEQNTQKGPVDSDSLLAGVIDQVEYEYYGEEETAYTDPYMWTDVTPEDENPFSR